MLAEFTRVRANDGTVYLDPKLSGNGWFVCFEEEGQPELVIEAGRMTPTQARQKAIDLATEVGLSAMVCTFPRKAERAFVKDGRLQRLMAYGFNLDLLAPIPWEDISPDYRGLRSESLTALSFSSDPWG